ncbi:arginine--tRNA ligase [Fulvivirgaceae bacterium BMA12]|uniref:Arginine--tRNA ligase n=1 Tax=Agaribacillus aureus TaxID=3051825 RepID=A0ABT8KZN7_9BACT|nr:arginine--tRNA ligase [Fulvivirgaceae bacterium BMA12]
MDINQHLKKAISNAFKEVFHHELSGEEVALQPTRKEFEGSHTFVVFPYLKITRKPPEASGELLGTHIVDNTDIVQSFNVVKGFLNLELTDKLWIDIFNQMAGQENYGLIEATQDELMVEYSSPNTNKPLHLGHLRNNFLGYAVSKILEAQGNKVHKVQIINDRGIHICKSMVAWLKYGQGETPESSGTKGDKLVGDYYVKFDREYKLQIEELIGAGHEKEWAEKNAQILLEAQDMLRKWEQKEPEVYNLWEKMNGWVYSGFEASYNTMGVTFDKLYYESNTFLLGKDEILSGLEKGIFFKKEDGSVWVDLTEDGLDQKILLRSDGTSVYMTQDIGTAILRFRDFPNIKSQIYTVGNEQEYHFRVLFLILDKLGYTWAKNCYHLSYGMVDLPSGKMKSREGTVVDADDLMQQMVDTAAERTRELGKIDGFTDEQASDLYNIIGLGALKYFILKVDPRKRMLFNPEESIDFQGNTAPFIQYTYARIAAILRKAKQLSIADQPYKITTLHSAEKEVVMLLNEFPDRIKLAAKEYAPYIIAQFAYDLAKEYNRFYAEVSIFNEENKNALYFRIAFSAVVARTIKTAMGLLGIEVPERM